MAARTKYVLLADSFIQRVVKDGKESFVKRRKGDVFEMAEDDARRLLRFKSARVAGEPQPEPEPAPPAPDPHAAELQPESPDPGPQPEPEPADGNGQQPEDGQTAEAGS